MKRVDTGGLYHYEVIGEREAEAARELARRLDILSRQYDRPSAYVGMDMSEAAADIRKEFGVVVRAKI